MTYEESKIKKAQAQGIRNVLADIEADPTHDLASLKGELEDANATANQESCNSAFAAMLKPRPFSG